MVIGQLALAVEVFAEIVEGLPGRVEDANAGRFFMLFTVRTDFSSSTTTLYELSYCKEVRRLDWS